MTCLVKDFAHKVELSFTLCSLVVGSQEVVPVQTTDRRQLTEGSVSAMVIVEVKVVGQEAFALC